MKEPGSHRFTVVESRNYRTKYWLLGGCSYLQKHQRNQKKVDEGVMKRKELGKAATKSFQSVLLQIIMIDLVFSFDSILTALWYD
jgi:predicted tellurium resistance membrane protein TerC